MEYNKEGIRELAERIYDLDAEVYAQLGSSLGRVFNRDRESCVKDLCELMMERKQAHLVRSELALISNMARTIPDRGMRKMIMSEYDKILKDVTSLPTSFAEGDILDQQMAEVNALHLENRFSGQDHRIICIGRTYGSGGTEIGFALADSLKMNFYDVEIFNAVLNRLEAEKDLVEDTAGHPYRSRRDADGNVKTVYTQPSDPQPAFAKGPERTLKQRMKEFSRYHGLSKSDAVFFNQSDLICDMAKKEDFIIMGRCANVILANNRIPHISIFINAPFEQRVHRIMAVNEGKMTEKQTVRMLKKMDREHVKYYKYYTGQQWGNSVHYDLCINSASYGIEGSVELIRKMVRG